MELFREQPELALLLGGMLLLIFTLRKRATSHFRRIARTSDGRATAPSATAPVNAADASPDVARWEVHLRETARELSAQLDSKMVALQHLIRQAREEEARLQQILKGHGRQHELR